MKLKVSLALVALAVISLAFKGKEKNQIRVQVIHNTGDGNIAVYDTIFEKSSNYTVEDFLNAKGIAPEATDIIDLDVATTQPANDVWVLKEKDANTSVQFQHLNQQLATAIDSEEEIEVQTIKMVKTKSTTTKTFVDGVETDTEQIEEKIASMQLVIDSLIQGIEMTVNADGKVHQTIRINGVIVEDGTAESTWNDSLESEVLLQTMALENLSNEVVQVRAILINEEAEAISAQNIQIAEALTAEAEARLPSFTVALVSTVDPKANKTARKEDHTLAIDHLQFFPKPNNGIFTVAFDLAQQGDTQLQILNINGQEVYGEMLQNFTGHYEKQMDLSGQPTGTYILSITQNGKRLADKVIIH